MIDASVYHTSNFLSILTFEDFGFLLRRYAHTPLTECRQKDSQRLVCTTFMALFIKIATRSPCSRSGAQSSTGSVCTPRNTGAQPRSLGVDKYITLMGPKRVQQHDVRTRSHPKSRRQGRQGDNSHRRRQQKGKGQSTASIRFKHPHIPAQAVPQHPPSAIPAINPPALGSKISTSTAPALNFTESTHDRPTSTQNPPCPRHHPNNRREHSQTDLHGRQHTEPGRVTARPCCAAAGG